MANEETNERMSDTYYNVNTDNPIVFTSLDGFKVYTPKKWEEGEVIQTIEMNNIEQGI